MIANPTRVDWEATPSPLQEGNRVLESIARQEALRALLAFSGLHEQIRNRRLAGHDSERDLFETERFILDEVLQLICDRAQAITQADGIVVALAEGPETMCRAAAGPLAVERGVHLIGESEFLRDCLESGRILRCDDCEIDARVELDIARQIGARSTVLVPLRGRSKPLGVLQAFSGTPSAFTDYDVRCFDLFAELVLSALRPEDQDRRLHWLSGVADEVLQVKVAVSMTVIDATALETPELDTRQLDTTEIELCRISVETGPVPSPSPSSSPSSAEVQTPSAALPPSDWAVLLQPIVIPVAMFELPEAGKADEHVHSDHVHSEELATEKLDTVAPFESPGAGDADEHVHSEHLRSEELDSEKLDTAAMFESSDSEKLDTVAMFESPEAGKADEHVHRAHVRSEELDSEKLESVEVDTEKLDTEAPATLTETLPASPLPLRFLQRVSLAGSSHPGLRAVMGLVAVAALFSAGAWWGTREQGKAATKVAATNTAAPPPAVTTPPAPTDALSPTASDNLMNPEKPSSDAAQLPEFAENKSATLSKITSVRHWSSSTGSTVVIDMDDQVPYEIHRLMSPERIYFDLHDTVLSPELNGKTMDVGDTSLTRVRVAQLATGVTRIVLDTKGGSNFSVSMESSPYRLVVELHGGDKTFAKNSVPPNILPNIPPNQAPVAVDAAPAPSKAAPVTALPAKGTDQLLPARTGKIRIVLDAGHGGWDSGTVGRQGLLEKDLVLDVTQRLGRLLQERLGVEVMFTRTSDTYLPLEQRADFANAAQADLFVSVHANYSNYAAARGVETYYTNLFSAPGSRDVEKHEDGTFAKPTPVSLSVDALHEKIEESQRLAASVQHSLYSALAANSSGIRNRGIKDSAFVVLTGTTMPAILTEISFVSSPADEHNLQTTGYRQQIAEALYQGIASYQQSSPRAKVAQLQTGTKNR
jgi:N-acetylmuramoyl-L-alanine amidase